MRWHTNPLKCSHTNEDICKTCDFDRYYRSRPEAVEADLTPAPSVEARDDH